MCGLIQILTELYVTISLYLNIYNKNNISIFLFIPVWGTAFPCSNSVAIPTFSYIALLKLTRSLYQKLESIVSSIIFSSYV